MILLKSVSKQFDGIPVLPLLDLDLQQGMTTVLIGPSGCGKSTIIRLILGLVLPDAGTIQIDRNTISNANISDLRQRIGYVVQDGGLFPHFTAEENIILMARWLGWTEDKIKSRLTELTTLTHFPANGLNRYPVQLSGGQRQRVALMRALMLDPDILLLDEPLGALDPIIRYELQTELRDIFRSLKKTVVMVTHDMGEAAYFGDVIVLMREEAIVQQGDLEALVKTPAEPFVTDFIQAHRGLHDSLREVAS